MSSLWILTYLKALYRSQLMYIFLFYLLVLCYISLTHQKFKQKNELVLLNVLSMALSRISKKIQSLILLMLDVIVVVIPLIGSLLSSLTLLLVATYHCYSTCDSPHEQLLVRLGWVVLFLHHCHHSLSSCFPSPIILSSSSPFLHFSPPCHFIINTIHPASKWLTGEGQGPFHCCHNHQ